MTRRLTIALTITAASLIAGSFAHADCGRHGCQLQYGPYSARQAFILFQQRPEMITQFPQIARELEAQFGTIQSGATPNPAAITAAPVEITPPAVPAQFPAQIPATVETPAVIAPISGVTEAPAEVAPIATPSETAAPLDLDANPDAPPSDLPTVEPPVNI